MAITDWPAAERPREKLLERGAAALTDAELLAIFLRTGLPGLTAVDLARTLLTDYGSLAALLAADQASFCAGKGLGSAKFVQLQAVLEMSRRYLLDELRTGPALTSPGDARSFVLAQLRSLPHEVFACIWLDNQHRVLLYEPLFTGTIDGAAVYPREVVRRALSHNAAAVILAHNHPSGVAEPSDADRRITDRLIDSLNAIDVRVLDHMVVGAGVVVSFAERGWLR